MKKQYIAIEEARKVLKEINEWIKEPLLLVGGIAVNHYVKGRDSHDIDLICTHSEATEIIKNFPQIEWNIDDTNDDHERPHYVITKKSNGNIVIIFGPKITERGEYTYINWQLLQKNTVPMTYQNAPLENIVIPNVSYLAYMKIISYIARENDEKKEQDLVDFINLSNNDGFSPSLFYHITKDHGASEYIKKNFLNFSKMASNIKLQSVLVEFYELFDMGKDDLSKLVPSENEEYTRGTTKFIDSMLDAVLFFRDATVFANEEILDFIGKDRVIPYRLLYKTEQGTRRWLNLCESPTYTFYIRSYNYLNDNISDLIGKIVEAAGRTDFDLVSLGVGDGRKDALVIKSIISQMCKSEILYYYPMDISPYMIEKTARYLANDDELMQKLDRLRIKPFVGDFLGIDKMDLIYNYRESPNIFCLLGNTIGNDDEDEIVQTLQGAVQAGDFIILELNTDTDGGDKEQLQRSTENKLHDLSPLEAVGIKYNPSDLQYKTYRGKSMHTRVSGTLTSLAECKVQADGEDEKIVKLSVVNYYNFENFVKYISQQLKMEILYQSQNKDKDVGLLVLQKLPD